jgi:hypothetical protein
MYDYDFIDYTIRVLRKCKEFGFKVYMDPHQDIVSVYSTTYRSSSLTTKMPSFMTRFSPIRSSISESRTRLTNI